MTFREVDVFLLGALRREARMVMTGAWLSASWQRAKKLPSYERALGPLAGSAGRRRSWEAQLAYVRNVLVPMTDIKLVEGSPGPSAEGA